MATTPQYELLAKTHQYIIDVSPLLFLPMKPVFPINKIYAIFINIEYGYALLVILIIVFKINFECFVFKNQLLLKIPILF
jgi:hypothetical protein